MRAGDMQYLMHIRMRHVQAGGCGSGSEVGIRRDGDIRRGGKNCNGFFFGFCFIVFYAVLEKVVVRKMKDDAVVS
jgi:hypothetical protein